MQFKKLSLGLIMVMLSACVDDARLHDAQLQTMAQGFQGNLQHSYLIAAQDERKEHDHTNAIRLAEKSISAGQGQQVMPDVIPANGLEPTVAQELNRGRTMLLALQDHGGRDAYPSQLSRAQVYFDHWLIEEVEGWQTGDIAASKKRFWDEINGVRLRAERSERLEPPATPEKPESCGNCGSAPRVPVRPETPAVVSQPEPVQETPPRPVTLPFISFTVLFDFDAYHLTEDGKAVLDRVRKEMDRRMPTLIRISGHTDRAGSESYNLSLSSKRVQTVKNYLIAMGVDEALINMRATGEEELEVETPDGVREPRNRRVFVILD